MNPLLTKSKFLFLFFAFTIFSSLSFAFVAPQLTGPVVDLAQMLSPEGKDQLKNKLIQFRNEHGAQVQVLTIPSLEDLPVEDYSQKVFVAWKLGDATRDDGVLFLIAKQERKMRIHVGYGLEGVLTDALTSQILREHTKPNFKNGDFEKGITQTVDRILFELRPDQFDKPLPVANSSKTLDDDMITFFVFGGFLIIFVFVFFIVIFSSNRAGKKGGSRNHDNSIWFGSSSDSSSSSSDSWSGGGGDSGGGGASDDW